MLSDGANTSIWLPMDAGASMSSLTGDFYPEEDNVTRGLSLPMLMVDSNSQSPMCGSEALRSKGSALSGDHLECMNADSRVKRTPVVKQPSQTRFGRCQGRTALPLPFDSCLSLEATSFIVRSSSAWLVGNRIIDFLEGACAASVTKLNHDKYTIKADMFVNGSFCEAKVRVYYVSIGQYAVEMQRRSGDGVAFFHAFRRASQLLGSDATLERLEEDVAFTCPEVDASTQLFLPPLVDLVETNNMQLQTEAAQFLVCAASNASVALQICTTHALIALGRLFQAQCFAVAVPLAHLLSSLAIMPGLEMYMIEQRLVQKMTEMVWIDTIGRVISELLARAVCHCVSQLSMSSFPLSPHVCQELVQTLSEKVNTMNHGDSEVANNVSASSPTLCYLQDSLKQLAPFELCH